MPELTVLGMRNSANILVYIDVQKALDAGIKFSLSANGVVLTEGDEAGYLRPQFFQRVTDKKGNELSGWQSPSSVDVSTSEKKNQETTMTTVGESTVAVETSQSGQTEQPDISTVEKATEKLSL